MANNDFLPKRVEARCITQGISIHEFPLLFYIVPFLLRIPYRTKFYYVDLLQVGRVGIVLEPDEVLLDAARRDEAVEDGHAAGLVVRAARACATERLLANDGTSALFIIVDVPGGVAQLVSRRKERLAVRREASEDMSA